MEGVVGLVEENDEEIDDCKDTHNKHPGISCFHILLACTPLLFTLWNVDTLQLGTRVLMMTTHLPET